MNNELATIPAFILLTSMGAGASGIWEFYRSCPDSRQNLWWMIPLGLSNGWILSKLFFYF